VPYISIHIYIYIYILHIHIYIVLYIYIHTILYVSLAPNKSNKCDERIVQEVPQKAAGRLRAERPKGRRLPGLGATSAPWEPWGVSLRSLKRVYDRKGIIIGKMMRHIDKHIYIIIYIYIFTHIYIYIFTYIYKLWHFRRRLIFKQPHVILLTHKRWVILPF
jgi:hypothetical protein